MSVRTGMKLVTSMTVLRVVVSGEEGWHARPITTFANLVADSGLLVTIGRPGETQVRADSVLSLMTLGVRHLEELVITVDSTDVESVAVADFLERAAKLF